MKNVKLTVATTLSLIALTFSGVASADSFDRQKHFKQHNFKHNVYKQHIHKQHAQKHKNMIVQSSVAKKSNRRVVRNNKGVKRVIVRNTPTKKVIITKTIIKKPAKARFVSNKRFNNVKRYKQYSNYNNRYKRHNRFKANRAAKQFVYSVRPGDTLIRVSVKTGVSVNQLARLNRINHRNLNNLRIGQVLRLI